MTKKTVWHLPDETTVILHDDGRLEGNTSAFGRAIAALIEEDVADMHVAEALGERIACALNGTEPQEKAKDPDFDR